MERVTEDKGRTFTKQVDIMNVQRYFCCCNLYKRKIDKEGMGKKQTKNPPTFMGNTTTPTLSAAQKHKCEGVVVESELLYAL